MSGVAVWGCGARLLGLIFLTACGDPGGYERDTDPSTPATSRDAGERQLDSALIEEDSATPQASDDASRPTGARPGTGSDADSSQPSAPSGQADGPEVDARVADGGSSRPDDAGGPTPSEGDAGGSNSASSAKLPPVSSVAADGPFTTTVDSSAGPGRAALVVRPATLGENGLKHPVFIWGPGGGTQPRNYETLMRRIASHGFVVYSEVSRGANGSEMLAAITWLTSENQRSGGPYHQKLDESKIGVGGHSYGSNSAMSAASDPRIKAFVHAAGSAFRGSGKARNLKQPAAFVCGEDDPTANVTDCRTDYMQTGSPVFFTIMANEDHLSTPRAGLSLMVAWLRWHLGGENERRSMFIGDDCEFCKGVYTSVSKNW
jgi:hypothetical protein